MSDNTVNINDFKVLTTVPVKALAQPLLDFLTSNGIYAFTFEDDTGLDATQSVEVRVTGEQEDKAKALLADFWAKNEAKGDEM